MTVSYTRTVPEMAEHVGKDRPIMTVDAEDLRAFFGSLRESHSVGGVHHCCRNVEAFFRWFWLEYEIDKFNPIDKVSSKLQYSFVDDRQYGTIAVSSRCRVYSPDSILSISIE